MEKDDKYHKKKPHSKECGFLWFNQLTAIFLLLSHFLQTSTAHPK